MNKQGFLLLAGLLSALPPGAVHSLRTESYFAPSGGGRRLEVVSASAIVQFRAGASTAAAAAELGSAGFPVENYSPQLGMAAVRLPEGMSVAAGLAALRSLPAVAAAGPNRAFKPSLVPDDTLLPAQYALSTIQAFGAWEYETGSSSRATVAVIDTGIDGTHPELSGKLAGTSWRFNPSNGASLGADAPTPACNHATRAAGVAAAAAGNAAGVAGVSWGAKLISLKVFAVADCNDAFDNFSCQTSEWAIAAAINYVAAQHNSSALGKVVVNMSLGASGSCSDSAPVPLQTAVTNAVAAGVLLFAASGNSAASYMDSPANCTGVTAVGATDATDTLAYFSNTDPAMASKGVTAPGVEVYTTDMGGGYASATGTSFSSPMTAGLAALLWSASPASTADQVKNFIFDSADDLGPAGPDKEYGRGRINALKAMRLARNETRAFRGENKAVAYPNPFRPAAHRMVTFSVPSSIIGANAEVKVYTQEGELVRKITGLAWDGTNAAGAPAASGVYLFRVKTDKDAANGKFALLRP